MVGVCGICIVKSIASQNVNMCSYLTLLLEVFVQSFAYPFHCGLTSHQFSLTSAVARVS